MAELGRDYRYYKHKISFYQRCYGPSVISVTVTTGGHPRGGGLYGTSGTMRRGVAESRG